MGLTIKNSACQSGDVSTQVGACCPAGSQWSSSQNACASNQCEPLVTLPYGRDLTLVKNAGGEAFSSNGACANKQISLSPCSMTAGAVAAGASVSGNKLYAWPKTSS